MPTRTIDTQTYEGEQIQCAKFVSDAPFTRKFAQVVNAECDYEFQFVVKSSAEATLTIQVGDSIKTQVVGTDWTRYVIPFPAVTNDVDSLYISFPAGTYWLYNLQLERASTPSAWRPAPEDAEDYADAAAQQAVDDQTQLDIFNKLTNNGASQGIYLLDGQLYINGEYIAADTISGNKIHGGTISGTQINIGDNVFVVSETGEVIAANINITGGTINIDTEGALAQNKIILRHTYNGTTKYVALSGNNLSASVGNDSYKDVVQIDGDTIWCVHQPTGGSLNTAYKLYNLLGAGNLELYDTSGKLRAKLNGNGLQFYGSDGTTVKNLFPATGNPTIRT